jgi:hypothetical protein
MPGAWGMRLILREKEGGQPVAQEGMEGEAPLQNVKVL